MAAQALTEQQVRDLPVTVSVPVAGLAFGMERSKAYRLHREGQFPCKVLILGSRFVVTKSALLEALGYETPGAQVAA